MKRLIAIAFALALGSAFAAGGLVRGAAAHAGMIADDNGKELLAYTQDGLVAHWDGIANAGRNIHDATATTWKDLTGHGYDFISIPLGTQLKWEANCLYNTASRTTTVNGLGYIPASSGLALDTFAPTNGYRTFEFCIIPYSSYMDTFMDFGNHSGYTVKYLVSGWQGTGRSVLDVGAYNNFGVIANGALWSAAVIVKDTTALTFYKDGVFLQNETSHVYRPTADLPIILGCSYGGSPYDKCGRCRYYAIRVYNRALTAAEIKHNHEVDMARFGLN